MKQITAIIVSIMLCATTATSQQMRAERLCTNEQFVMHSGSNSTVLGSRSRSYRAVVIPQGTVAIAFTVKAVSEYNAMQNMKLAMELGGVLSGNPEISTIASQLSVPNGDANIDVFVATDFNSVKYFMNKDDNNFSHIRDYSCIGVKGCTRVFETNSGDAGTTIYVCMKNPSAFNEISGILSVVAIVK